MSTFCLTFGDKFRREEHPKFPDAHPDGWVEIEANDYADAVRIGYELYGFNWANAYPKDILDRSFFPRGCLAVLEPSKEEGE